MSEAVFEVPAPAPKGEASEALYERARRVLPGGTTRGSIFYRPHPQYAAAAAGCRVVFEDGHEAVDFLNNFTTLVLGHRHPAVMAAVRDQLDRGNVFGAPTRGEVELAELLVERYRTIERVILTSTGSEAVMAGIRVARAVTGRPDIAKFEGGYHGGYDHAKVSAMSGPDDWGDEFEPDSVPDTAGIPESAVREVHVMRFNSLESVERVFSRAEKKVAALVMEPVIGAGGLIPPADGFLEGVLRVCHREGALLLFDEVITQRLSVGGAQELYGVAPDLTVFSKVMSAGFPIGVLGGRAEIMDAFDPTVAGGPLVYHSGTFNGNPLSVAAALATLRSFGAAEIEHIDDLGANLRAGLEDVIRATGARASVTGLGSLANVHFTAPAPREYRAVHTADRSQLEAFHLRMLNRGFMLATRGLASVSTPMGAAEIDTLVSTAHDVLVEVGDPHA